MKWFLPLLLLINLSASAYEIDDIENPRAKLEVEAFQKDSQKKLFQFEESRRWAIMNNADVKFKVTATTPEEWNLLYLFRKVPQGLDYEDLIQRISVMMNLSMRDARLFYEAYYCLQEVGKPMEETFPGIGNLIERFVPDDELDDYKQYFDQTEQEEKAKERLHYYEADIEKFSNAYNVDRKLLQAILVFESTVRGDFRTKLDSIAFTLYLGSSAQPTNIGRQWSSLLARDDDSLRDESNAIEATAILLKRIEERLEKPTVGKIASMYNFLGRENVSTYGHVIEHIYQKDYLKEEKKD